VIDFYIVKESFTVNYRYRLITYAIIGDPPKHYAPMEYIGLN
jgi:hypothetical protein